MSPGEKALTEAFEAIMEGRPPNLPQPDKTAKRANMHGTRFRFEIDLTKPKEPPK